MSAIEDMHDDEIRARLGMGIGSGKRLIDRIESHVVRQMPEPFEVEQLESEQQP